MKTTKSNQLKSNQAGLASIVVTMIVMIVISLIVLAAARLARREQQQALDRQLSTQAFYAAESGVNDAVKAIETDLTNGGTLLDIDYTANCDGFMTATSTPANSDLPLNPDLGTNVKYSCLLVDPTPTTWEGNIDDTSRTIPIEDDGGSAISVIEIAWQDKDGGTNFGCPSNFPPSNSWGCETPMLRFDLVPITNNVNRGTLNDSVMTGFLSPTPGGTSGTTLPYTPNSILIRNGTPVKQTIECNKDAAPKFCKVRITGLGGTSYYLRIKSIYGSASVTVSAQNASGDKFELVGAQVVIDSTGKANDVLRRIQVRVPLIGGVDIPEFAIQSGDTICKLLEVSGATASAKPECPIN